MGAQGWISLHRKVQDCWLWADKEPFDKRSAWVDLILMANHRDGKVLFDGELITVKAGQRITSIRKLADRWHWSKDKVRRFLNLLETDQMITRESDKRRTLLTIVNYGVYQGVSDSDEYSNGTVTGQSQVPNNNDNNENKYILSAKPDETEQKYLSLYNVYPKKVGRSGGLKVYRTLVGRGRQVNGSRIKLTHEQIATGLNNYYQHQLKMNQGEIGDIQFWKSFDRLLKEIQDWVEVGNDK